jgi:hypothetical protein
MPTAEAGIVLAGNRTFAQISREQDRHDATHIGEIDA